MINVRRVFDVAIIDNTAIEMIEETISRMYGDYCRDWGSYPELIIGIQLLTRGESVPRRAVVMTVKGDELSDVSAEELNVEAFNSVQMFGGRPSGVFRAVGSAHVYANMLAGSIQVSVLGSRCDVLGILLAYEALEALHEAYEQDCVFYDALRAIRSEFNAQQERIIRKYERKNFRRLHESGPYLRAQYVVFNDTLF